MCGIAGILTAAPQGGAQAQIEAMTLAVRHRGPDAGAVFVDDEAGVALGHRRLAILDLSERGAQPMHSERGRYVLTFNGEIYNHLTLRRELEESGPVRGARDFGHQNPARASSAWASARLYKKPSACSPLGSGIARSWALDAGARPFRREAALLRLYRAGERDDLRVRFGIEGAAAPIPISIIQNPIDRLRSNPAFQ